MARGSIAPGESVAGQVRLSAPALRDLIISLSTDLPDAVRVPTSVRIARGQSEASFLVVGVLSGNSERRVVRVIGHLEGVERSAQLLLIQRSPTPARQVEILEFSADPPVITPGEEVVLSFRLANAQTAHIEPDVGALPSLISGTVRVRPRQSREYTLVATGPDGRETRRRIVISLRRPPQSGQNGDPRSPTPKISPFGPHPPEGPLHYVPPT